MSSSNSLRAQASRNRLWLSITAVLVIIGAIFTLGIFGAHRIHNYTSDDVAHQTIVAEAGKYGKVDAWMGVDNFVTKLPFYQLVHATLGESRMALLVTVITFNTIAFGGLVAAFLIVWRGKLEGTAKKIAFPVAVGLLGFMWIASLGSDTAVAFINPNVRNAEVGICILLAVLALDRSLAARTNWYITALLGFIIGLFIYNDPYFLYVLFVPLALVPVYYFFWSNDHKLNVIPLYVTLAIGFITYKLAGLATGWIGFHAYDAPVSFASLTSFGQNLDHTVYSFLSIFHANFFGQPATVFTGIMLINTTLALLVVGLAVYALLRRTLPDHYGVLFAISIVTTIALYMVTSNSDSLYTVRYLVMVPYLAIFLIPWAITSLQNVRVRRLVLVLMGVAIVGNLYMMVLALKPTNIPSIQLANTENLTVVSQLESLGLTKGYSSYWDGNIHTYLSGGKALTLPVVCNGKNLQIYYWLMDSAWLNKKADRTYLLVNKNEEPFIRCTQDMIDHQFGTPKDVIHIDSLRQAYIYDYDIYSHMPSRQVTTSP